MKYKKQGHLLQLGSNTKLNKSGDEWLIAGLSLAPSDIAGKGYRVCTHEHVAGCVQTCLFYAGRGAMKSVQQARIKRTKLLFDDPVLFMHLLDIDIDTMIKYADRKKKQLAIRLNVLSDYRWENYLDMESYPTQFYDYTKDDRRLGNQPNNYHLTLSVFPHEHLLKSYLSTAKKTYTNIAAVFMNDIPATFEGFPTISGDDNDLRFLDPYPSCIALKAKGLLRHNNKLNFAI
jgi:hypothetical protein